MKLAHDAWGLPRHQSQHPGGMVISTQPLIDLCPVQPASMEGRQMVQWDKDSCGDAGFLKIDLLGPGDAVGGRALRRRDRARARRADRPVAHPATTTRRSTRAIQEAETMGVFQIESRAQMQMLKRTRPETLDDLTVQVALVRPGPIQGGAVHPYIEHRKALRADPSFEVPYEHPSLEPVLRDTLGTIVFQDQVLEVAMAFAGFTRGRGRGAAAGDEPRRSEAAIRAYEEKFVDGAIERGATRESAERVWTQIVGFSGFGFPKAHSAAFGLLAYQSTWLRVHYHPEFLCALLNEQPMGFYPPDSLVHEAQRRGWRCCRRAWRASAGGVHGARDGRGPASGSATSPACARQEVARARGRARARAARWRSLGDLAGALGRLGGDARQAGLGGRVRRARRRAGRARGAGALAARRGRAGHAGRRRAPSWRCRSSRTRARSCARCPPGSGCWPTTARRA